MSTGPAGCGKTMLACEAAAHRLRLGSVQRIIVTRPAVSADEELGFLPGERFAGHWILGMLLLFLLLLELSCKRRAVVVFFNLD